ncbi:hypothetical protein [Cupriavidus sp. Agwp_2]|uniref:hypothetical protein n=1 Tax=Cupriavidus sp. Agwp_2 TaxID=2897324 RepID=UPI0034614E8D
MDATPQPPESMPRNFAEHGPAAAALNFEGCNALNSQPATPWRLRLDDARYDWPQTWGVCYAARCVACWRVGAVPLYVGVDPPVFRVTTRQWGALTLADMCVVLGATVHADRMLLRLPEAIVRARHAQDIERLEGVANMDNPMDNAAARVGDAVGAALVLTHQEDICTLSALLQAYGAMDSEALALFACEHNLLHKPVPLLLRLANEDPKEPPL